MCRDHFPVPSKLKDALGSPPHVRGPRSELFRRCYQCGITPACAGTTMGELEHRGVLWDHPRMCGDHSNNRFFTVKP